MTDILDSNRIEEDMSENTLRPSFFDDFIGQEHAKNNLRVFIEAARSRSEALDHVLLYGPPGLGKTTIAQIIARELGTGFKATSGPLLSKAGDLAAILTNLQENDVLFIDEIHRLNTNVEEVLYSAMEDFQLDIIIGEGPAARTVRIELPKFTLVGATTRLGLLSNPLRDRFGIPTRLNFYSSDELRLVIERGANILKAQLTQDGANEIANRSRGTPRIALRLLRRVRDFAEVAGDKIIQSSIADESLRRLEVDSCGLDGSDRRYLRFIAEKYSGGPVGVETICAGLSEQRDSVEETIEPYLLQLGFIQRTPRGRVLTPQAFGHIGMAVPKLRTEQADIFE
ncbi:MAG: Holliday junction branch migration DNA helicase RuvB [Rickettsiales bacterium]|nr:Holliday junction branch migration DNA helicase RuvB [Pseudomonadota bacterium]MDA0965636.1 Holliday junction branch migration DNA helicase RuvB [Pseudomonadota bacterium]MDG4542960.1 Holliday junction branch migration DNA helicase RuvB [Rickettsiales bacterium]MDG4544592.1 Holliday junction branch migration DNA helicase RuvB [Rickettsiales bacterium]MDG4546714.1 Holliday junction branch migration DNA helicase RuvB [Rickettsiales bacterium]